MPHHLPHHAPHRAYGEAERYVLSRGAPVGGLASSAPRTSSSGAPARPGRGFSCASIGVFCIRGRYFTRDVPPWGTGIVDRGCPSATSLSCLPRVVPTLRVRHPVQPTALSVGLVGRRWVALGTALVSGSPSPGKASRERLSFCCSSRVPRTPRMLHGGPLDRRS